LAYLLGDYATPLLLALANDAVEYFEPVVHLPSLPTAMALKAYVVDRKRRPMAMAYYQANPSLGMVALSQVVSAGGNLAELARPLLGELRKLILLSGHLAEVRGTPLSSQPGAWDESASVTSLALPTKLARRRNRM
jgi:hypothetical protein